MPAAGSGSAVFLPEPPAVPPGPVTDLTNWRIWTERLCLRCFVGTARPIQQPSHLVAAVLLLGRSYGCDPEPKETDMIKARLYNGYRNRTPYQSQKNRL